MFSALKNCPAFIVAANSPLFPKVILCEILASIFENSYFLSLAAKAFS
jgi:hypothetical protein